MTSAPSGTPSRIVELRTHGVSGTPPESILHWDHVIQVAGDSDSRFHRRATPDGVEVGAEPVAGVERLLESYHWGEMTSGGIKKAAWILLIPFALTNIAQWTLPARAPRVALTPRRLAARRAGVDLARSLIRLIALGLTMLFAVQVEIIVVDLVASQCLAPGARCFDSVSGLRILRDHPLPRSVLAALVVTAVLAVVWFLGRDTLAKPPPEPVAKTSRSTPTGRPVPRVAARSFTETCPNSGALRTLHAMAAFSVLTLVLAGGESPAPGGWNVTTWWIALVLMSVSIAAVALLDDPSGGTGNSALIRRVFGRAHRVAGWALLAVADFVVAAAGGPTAVAASSGTGPSPLREAENYVLDELMPLLALGCFLLLVVVVLLRPLTRGGIAQMPRQFRPWLAGTLAPFAVAFAALAAAGFGTATAVFTDNCLTNSCKPRSFGADGASSLAMPAIYDAVTLMWGMVVVVVVAAVLVAGPLAFQLRKRRQQVQSRVQSGTPMRLTWFVANVKFSAQYVLAGVTLVAVVSGAVAIAVADEGASEPAWVRWLVEHAGFVASAGGRLGRALHLTDAGGQTGYVPALQALGVLGLVVAVGWLFAAIRKAARDPAEARNLGVIWDVASFWPAEAHPFVPPGYAQRALPDLQERIEAHLKAEPTARLVLCGHSQGSMIVYAVAWRMVAEHRHDEMLERFGLITHGSQLRWIFPRVFPGMLDFTDHRHLMTALQGRWHNVVRFTDPVGGPVLSWELTTEAVPPPQIRGTVLTMAGSEAAPVPGVSSVSCAQCDRRHGVAVLGHEHWLPDPVRPHPGPLGQPPAPGHAVELSGALQRHSNHPNDGHWPHVVALAAGLTPIPEPQPEPDPGRVGSVRRSVTAAAAVVGVGLFGWHRLSRHRPGRPVTPRQ